MASAVPSHRSFSGGVSPALLLAAIPALAVATPAGGGAQEPEPVVIGEAITVRSRVLAEDRRVLVYRPDGYDGSQARYPVLYLLDGEAHFHHVTGIVDFLAQNSRIPPMIVVGVANTARTRDLTPPAAVPRMRERPAFLDDSVTIEFPTAGGADAFLRFLTDELAPEVERRYRTLDFRLLAGHSFGGLFAVHALLSRPRAFDATIAVSPSLWWDEDALPAGAVARLAGQPSDPRFLYMTVGDQEGTMIRGLHDFVTVLERVRPEGLRWWYRVLPAETHGSVPHRSLYDGLETIFADYALPEIAVLTGDVDRVEEHFARASEVYGLDIPVPEHVLNRMGYAQLQFGRPEQAVRAFRRNVELHPGSANVYDSLADALEAVGSLAEALENRERAVRLAASRGDPRVVTFREKLAELRRRLGRGGG